MPFDKLGKYIDFDPSELAAPVAPIDTPYSHLTSLDNQEGYDTRRFNKAKFLTDGAGNQSYPTDEAAIKYARNPEESENPHHLATGEASPSIGPEDVLLALSPDATVGVLPDLKHAGNLLNTERGSFSQKKVISLEDIQDALKKGEKLGTAAYENGRLSEILPKYLQESKDKSLVDKTLSEITGQAYINQYGKPITEDEAGLRELIKHYYPNSSEQIPNTVIGSPFKISSAYNKIYPKAPILPSQVHGVYGFVSGDTSSSGWRPTAVMINEANQNFNQGLSTAAHEIGGHVKHSTLDPATKWQPVGLSNPFQVQEALKAHPKLLDKMKDEILTQQHVFSPKAWKNIEAQYGSNPENIISSFKFPNISVKFLKQLEEEAPDAISNLESLQQKHFGSLVNSRGEPVHNYDIHALKELFGTGNLPKDDLTQEQILNNVLKKK